MTLSEQHRQKMESLSVAAELFADAAFEPFLAEYSSFKILLEGGHQAYWYWLLAIAGVGTGYLLGGDELSEEDHKEAALCLKDGLVNWPEGSYETLVDFFQSMVAELGERHSFHLAIGEWVFSKMRGKIGQPPKKLKGFLTSAELQEFVGGYTMRTFQEYWEATKLSAKDS